MATNPFVLLLYYLSCKNIWGTYKKESKLFRIGICVALFFTGFVLSTLFLLLLMPNLAPSSLAELSWMFSGFFAEIISLSLKLRETQKHHKTSSKEYKSVRNNLILTIAILIVFFCFLQFV